MIIWFTIILVLRIWWLMHCHEYRKPRPACFYPFRFCVAPFLRNSNSSWPRILSLRQWASQSPTIRQHTQNIPWFMTWLCIKDVSSSKNLLLSFQFCWQNIMRHRQGVIWVWGKHWLDSATTSLGQGFEKLWNDSSLLVWIVNTQSTNRAKLPDYFVRYRSYSGHRRIYRGTSS